MAFGAKQIPPLDTRPGTGIGIAIPFNAPAVFFTTYTTKDAIRNNLLNFFLTNQTERYLNNNFGANLRNFLFEQINSDSISFLQENIQSLINTYFPNIKVTNLQITTDPDNNSLNVSLFYDIINTGVSDQVEITFA